MGFRGNITTDVIERILSGDEPRRECIVGLSDYAWIADEIPDGPLNGVIYLRSSLVSDGLALPDGWVRYDHYVEVNYESYVVIHHQRLHAPISHYTVMRSLNPTGGISRMYHGSSVYLGDMYNRIMDSSMEYVAHMVGNTLEASTRYIHATVNDDGMISCLPRDRYDPTVPLWKQKGRAVIRPGKFFRGLGGTYTDYMIERAVNEWNATYIPIEAEFRMVEGRDIKTYYAQASYAGKAETGSMGTSCMRYRRCEPYLTLYTQNRHVVKLLILEKPDGKIIGRALVWNADSGTFMDRVYGTDVTQRRFIDYAMSKGWYSRWRQTYTSQTAMRDPAGNEVHRNVRITLNTRRVRRWPFLDTFAYVGDGWLDNYGHEGYVGFAQDTDGGISSRNGRVRCRVCAGMVGGSIFDPPTAQLCAACTQRGYTICEECQSVPAPGRTCRHCEQRPYRDRPATHYWDYLANAMPAYAGHEDDRPPAGNPSSWNWWARSNQGLDVYRDLDGFLWIPAGMEGYRPPTEDEYAVRSDEPLPDLITDFDGNHLYEREDSEPPTPREVPDPSTWGGMPVHFVGGRTGRGLRTTPEDCEMILIGLRASMSLTEQPELGTLRTGTSDNQQEVGNE